MKNYAGHRLSSWLGHLMVSRQETARPLMTPGEVMQLSPDDEIVMVAGVPAIRARKARYFEDRRLTNRILPPPKPSDPRPKATPGHCPRWRQFDRIDRRMQGLERDLGVSIEAMAVFVLFWLASTPQLPNAAQAATRKNGGRAMTASWMCSSAGLRKA